MPPGSSLLNGKPLGTTDLGGFARAGPHPLQPTKVWGSKPTAPLPTNRWWVNLVLADGENGVGENVVSPLPYLVKAMADGLHACLPTEDATPTYVALPFEDTLALGARELQKGAAHTIDEHDALSVTVGWSAEGSGDAGSAGPRMATPLALTTRPMRRTRVSPAATGISTKTKARSTRSQVEGRRATRQRTTTTTAP